MTRSGVGHGLGQLEIAVVVEDGVQADGSMRRGLEVGQVFGVEPVRLASS